MSDTPESVQSRKDMIASAVKLAVEMSSDGSQSLSDFLSAVEGPVRDAAGEHLLDFPTKDIGEKGGKLASEVAVVALDVADAARKGFSANQDARKRTVDTMSEVVSFLGSMFIDTANKAVGTSAAQPATNRARLVTVTVDSEGSGTASVWVVNRSDSTVPNARVEIVKESNTLTIDPEPKTLTIAPGRRERIDLSIKDSDALVPGSFTDALLIVKGVGSIVVRTVVPRQPPVAEASATGPE
jgi:hypothetical protein